MATKRQRIIKRLDKLWREIGSNKFCEVCETLPPEERVSYSKVDNHHIITRSNKLLRWDLRNRCRLCSSHHMFGNLNAENNQGGWFLNWFSDDDWMGKHRPEDKEYLRKKRNQFKQWKMYELEELEDELKEMLNEVDEYVESVLS